MAYRDFKDLRRRTASGKILNNKGLNITKKKKKNSVEKVIKKKGDKLSAKWKGCNNYINSWIDKKDMFI